MDGLIDGEVARIRQRIRRWREEQNLTLQELASRSGLATSTVQKVETGPMVPSVAVLLKVAYGLGRRPTELIHEGEPELEVVHSRADERGVIGKRNPMAVERLSSDVADPALEMWRVTLAGGASSGSDRIRYSGEELVVCERGRVTFEIGDTEYELVAGDTLHFKAHIPHRWHNAGRSPAQFTITGTLPDKFRALIHGRAAKSA